MQLEVQVVLVELDQLVELEQLEALGPQEELVVQVVLDLQEPQV